MLIWLAIGGLGLLATGNLLYGLWNIHKWRQLQREYQDVIARLKR